MENLRSFLGWGTRGVQLIPLTIMSTKIPWEVKIFRRSFRVEVHAGDSWSLHDHHPENDKRWKISVIFGLRYTRGTTDPFTITSLKTMKKWKISNDFWVEEHPGYNWSLHAHQPENHEKWKTSDSFWVEVHRGGQLIPSRSLSLNTMENEEF